MLVRQRGQELADDIQYLIVNCPCRRHYISMVVKVSHHLRRVWLEVKGCLSNRMKKRSRLFHSRKERRIRKRNPLEPLANYPETSKPKRVVSPKLVPFSLYSGHRPTMFLNEFLQSCAEYARAEEIAADLDHLVPPNARKQCHILVLPRQRSVRQFWRKIPKRDNATRPADTPP